MEKYLQRLQAIFQKPEIAPRDARDGMIAAYVAVSCINQNQGNPGVGLHQEAEGIYNHIHGFMNAVFWERGFDFNNPTIAQLRETKIMIDGISQLYAMPERLQTGLNEVLDMLFKQAEGETAELSPESKKIFKIDISAYEINASIPAAEPEEEAMPSMPLAEPVPEPESAPVETESISWNFDVNVEEPVMPIFDAIEPAAAEPVVHEEVMPPVFDEQPAMPGAVIETIEPEETVAPSAQLAPEIPMETPATGEPMMPAEEPSDVFGAGMEPSTAAFDEPPSWEPAAVDMPGFDTVMPMSAESSSESMPMAEMEMPAATHDTAIPAMNNNDELYAPAQFEDQPSPAEPMSSKPLPGMDSWGPELIDQIEQPGLPLPETDLPLADEPIADSAKRSPFEKDTIDFTAASEPPSQPKRDEISREAVSPVSEMEYQLDWKPEELVVPEVQPAAAPMNAPAAKKTKAEKPVKEKRKPGRPRKNSESKPAAIPKVIQPGQKKRGRKPKVDEFGARIKTKRVRRINAKGLKIIDLGSIEVPDDYMSHLAPGAGAGPIDAVPATPLWEEPLGEHLPEPPSETMLKSEDEFGQAEQDFSLDKIMAPAAADLQPEESMNLNQLLELETQAARPDESPLAGGETPADQNTESHEGSEVTMSDDTFGGKAGSFGDDEISPFDDMAKNSGDSVPETADGQPANGYEQPLVSWENFGPQGDAAETPQAEETTIQPSRTFSYADQLASQPEPESSPSEWAEVQEPASAPTTYAESAPQSDAQAYSPILDTTMPPAGQRKSGMSVILALIGGLLLGALLSFLWFGIMQQKENKNTIESLKEQVKLANDNMETAKRDLEEAQQQAKTMKRIVDDMAAVAKKAPAKPQAFKTGAGVMLYWAEKNAVRKYNVYQAKAKSEKYEKVNKEPLTENMLILKKATPGAWKYAVAAVDDNGVETEKGQVLELKLPLKK